MARKKWAAKTELTEALLKSREKRKWQIALRRYVTGKNSSIIYAPYFGLDIMKLRQWFEDQFDRSMNWENFGTKWQFEHVIPVIYFDFASEDDLHICWNFLNLKAVQLQKGANQSFWLNISRVRKYFQNIYNNTAYGPCLKLINKLDSIEIVEDMDFSKQREFIQANRNYLDNIRSFTAFDFELLNNGKSFEEINKEGEFFKKFAGKQA